MTTSPPVQGDGSPEVVMPIDAKTRPASSNWGKMVWLGLVAGGMVVIACTALLFPDLRFGWIDSPSAAQAGSGTAPKNSAPLFAQANTSAPAAPKSTPQERPSKVRIDVPIDKISIDDGDTADIAWSATDTETVRILGIDTPEIQHVPHNIPYDQSFGREASGFAKGAFAAATKVELLRADTKDPYGRSLGYFFINGKNYSELVLRAGLAAESVSHYGDNGFPEEAKKMLEAAAVGGPVPFEPPHEFRTRMRKVTEKLKAEGKLD